MPTTAFAPISLADLHAVTGGCGKKKEAPPPPPPQQAAPPPPGGGQTEITTNVQMTGFGPSANGQ
jgi:hypothetical protein